MYRPTAIERNNFAEPLRIGPGRAALNRHELILVKLAEPSTIETGMASLNLQGLDLVELR
jgi:hypothetical protein